VTFSHTIRGRTHRFDSLKALLAKASSLRSGDTLAGIAADSDLERAAAKFALTDVPLTMFLIDAVIPYEGDDVTRLIFDTHDEAAFAPISHLTVGQLREWILSEEHDADALASVAAGLTPEMVAAVSKLMRSQDLILAARKCRVVTRFRNTLGLPGRMSVRLQPNHPTDDLQGVLASTIDGLLYGCGDAVIGVNPASDSTAKAIDLLRALDNFRLRFDAPRQTCVLMEVTNTLNAIETGAPVDLVFQSVAGTQKANESFGITLGLLQEAHEAARSLKRGTVGQNCMYFETRQGSALSAGAHLVSISRPARRAPMRWRADTLHCWSIRWLASSGLSIFLTESRSFAQASKITSAANCSACRWDATYATRTTPTLTRTTWIRCWALQA
jgi:ethanolamine ammonia-lyase large subunit